MPAPLIWVRGQFIKKQKAHLFAGIAAYYPIALRFCPSTQMKNDIRSHAVFLMQQTTC